MKKVIKYLFVMLLCMFLLVGCGKDKDKAGNVDGNKNPVINTNEGVIKEQEVDGLKFTNVGLVYDYTKTIFKVYVTNTTSNKVYVKSVDIEISNKDGELMEKLYGAIFDDIDPNETKEITANSERDLSKGVNIKYTINK